MSPHAKTFELATTSTSARRREWEYFLNSLFADIDSLTLYGGIHALKSGFHSMLASRFPYAVYYRLDNDEVVVRAVLDCRRNPAWIKKRLERERERTRGSSP